MKCCESKNIGCCGTNGHPRIEHHKSLLIEWQRLIKDEQTCPRCGSTEEALDKAVITLKQSLAPLEIEVKVEKRALSVDEFKREPLRSNQIWINGQPLENVVNASIGQSPCCDVCGPSECRTVVVDDHVYETIPSELIVKAGLLVATRIIVCGEQR